MLSRNNLLKKRQLSPLNVEQLFNAKPIPVASTSIGGIFDNQAIRIVHGKHCDADTGKEMAFEETFDLPSFATQATVLLNGWSFEYLGKDDHHVWAAGTWISNSRVEDGKLRWEARGLFIDDGQDDPYEWCYYYTIIAWNDKSLDCITSHRDIQNSVANLGKTPLVSTPSYFHSSRFEMKKVDVALPRGFLFHYGGIDDHHLRHIAYNLSGSEKFVGYDKKYGSLTPPTLNGSVSKVNSGFVSWDTQGIFQDNNYRRKFVFYTWNTILGGNEVAVVEPPHTIIPNVGTNEIGSGLSGETTKEYTINNIPYEIAMPMLTGWDLRYEFGDDEHVTKIGVWLDDIQYNKSPLPNLNTGGKLQYKVTSALYDKNKKPGYDFNHKVSILGFNPGIPNLPTDPQIE